jgi:hypothetical protein
MSSRLIISGALLALSCGSPGPAGPQGPVGPMGTPGIGFMTGPSINDVVPAAVAAGSEYDVTISGFATEWTDSAVVSFGAGVTVTRVKAASGTSLLVHLKVAPDAIADTRDVSVTQSMKTVYWRNAFRVLDRVKFTAYGTASQMSLSVVQLEVNEPSFEFDTSQSFGEFNGVSVVASPDFEVRVLSVSSKVVRALVMADSDAGIGAYDLNVISREGDPFGERSFAAPQIFTVTPLEQKTLVEDVPSNGTITTPFQSDTYFFTPGTGTVIATVTSSAPDVTPKLAVIDASSGRWADRLGYARTMRIPPGASYYLVVWEATGAANFSYTLEAAAPAVVTEEEPNDTAPGAKAVPIPGIASGSLSGEMDADFYKITATAADVGKRFHAITQPGDQGCDTVLEVFRTDGTTPLGAPSDDFGIHEDLLSGLIPAPGEYFVKVSWSTFSTWAAADSRYDLIVTIE